MFHRAIRETASADYSPEQVAVWADEQVDMEMWKARRAAAGTQVAVVDGEMAGFTDLYEDGTLTCSLSILSS